MSTKRPRKSLGDEITTSNRYDVLTDHENENSLDEDEGPSEIADQKAKQKVPPIVLTSNYNNPSLMIKEINEATTTKKMRFNFSRQGSTIHAHNKEDYYIIKNKLDASNSTYFTHPFKEDKLRHVVIKGLLIIPLEEVHEDLQQQGIRVIKVIRMKQRIVTNYPLYMVTLHSEQELSPVRRVKYAYLVKITWENYRNSRRVTQCRRCQLFGHGSSHCKNPPNCMICSKLHLTEEHPPGKNQQEKNDPPKCANCSGEHKANDANCEIYKKRLERLDSRNKKMVPEVQRQRLPPPPVSWSMKHYPQLKPTSPYQRLITLIQHQTSNSTHFEENTQATTSKEAHDLHELAAELKKLNALCNLGKMLRLVKTLNNRLTNCKTELDRLIVFSDILNDNGK